MGSLQAAPTYPRCPLCGGRDSIGHMLGECACPEIQAIIIERHNWAARLILAAVLAAALGACEVYADVGSLAKLGGLKVRGTRVPPSLLPDASLPEGPAQRAKLRPDIMLVEPSPLGGSRGNTVLGKRGPRARRLLRETGMLLRPGARRIRIVEVGYCPDTKHKEKLTEKTEQKTEQHRTLINLLAAEGHHVTQEVILLGSAGSVYKSTEASLAALGVDKATVHKLLAALSDHAISALHKLIKTRRQLEHSRSQRRTPPDPD